MKDYIHRFPRHIVIEIEKPLYTYEDADCVRIAEKYVKEATSNCQYLVVRTPKGEKLFMPKALRKVAKKVKEVFLYPDNPLVLYEINIPHSEKKEMDAYRWG
jgi:uncharacterized membrane protein YkoI